MLIFGEKSWCHGSLSVIVRSREGGFVTQNCISCGRPRALTRAEVPTLSCSTCGDELEFFVNRWNSNYAYRCRRCKWENDLGNLVPSWDQLFEYHGYAIEREDFAELTSQARMENALTTAKMKEILDQIYKIKRPTDG